MAPASPDCISQSGQSISRSGHGPKWKSAPMFHKALGSGLERLGLWQRHPAMALAAVSATSLAVASFRSLWRSLRYSTWSRNSSVIL
jgi:hypothetical protein